MIKCELCGGEDARIFKDRNEFETLYLCDGCAHDVKTLYALVVADDLNSYEKFKMDFLEDFNRNRCSRKIVEIAERKRKSIAADKDILDGFEKQNPGNFNTNKDVKNNTVNEKDKEAVNTTKSTFLPLKLQITTFFAVLALFLPCFGLGLALISKNMAFEIPLGFSEVDVSRARRLSVIAFWINLIEIILGIVAVIISCIIINANF